MYLFCVGPIQNSFENDQNDEWKHHDNHVSLEYFWSVVFILEIVVLVHCEWAEVNESIYHDEK